LASYFYAQVFFDEPDLRTKVCLFIACYPIGLWMKALFG
jgi:hypothetical protein